MTHSGISPWSLSTLISSFEQKKKKKIELGHVRSKVLENYQNNVNLIEIVLLLNAHKPSSNHYANYSGDDKFVKHI